MKEFPRGTWVKTSSGVCGEVLEGPDKKGFYALAVGQMRLCVAGDQLQVMRNKTARSSAATSSSHVPRESQAVLRLDLHGRTVAESLEALGAALDRALVEGTGRLEVIHGLGSGAVRDAVWGFLKSSKHVSSFRADIGNPGVTWVYI